jgi:HAD superfamily hydrolase (TIGR01484 family)
MSQPITAILPNRLQNVRLIATDMDGTLTRKEKFSSLLLHTLESLAAANFEVIIVTGRSAGWVEAIAHYFPIRGAIAENGGLFYDSYTHSSQLLTDIDNIIIHRQQLAQTFQLLQSKFPQLQESSDNCFRLTDWTFDVAGLTVAQLEQINSICQQKGWSFTYSTVQCHIKPLQQDKAIALQQVVKKSFSALQPEQIVTVGDSPNDQSLFDASKFPLSVGVANINSYRELLQYQPIYITHQGEVEGFRELAKLLIGYTS